MKKIRQFNLKSAVALLLVAVISLSSTVFASAAKSTVRINGKTLLTSFDIQYLREGKTSPSEYTYGISYSAQIKHIFLNNIPVNTSDKYKNILFEFYQVDLSDIKDHTSNAPSTYHSGYYHNSAGVTNVGVAINDLLCIDSETDEILSESSSLTSGTYLMSIYCGKDATGYYDMEAALLIEVGSDLSLGFYAPDFYERNTALREYIDETCKGSYYENFYKYMGTGGDALSLVEYNRLKPIVDKISASVPKDNKYRDYKLAKATYNYLADYLYYDLDNAFDTNSPSDIDIMNIMKTKKAVCAGFSVVYSAFLSMMDIPNNIILGYATGADLGNDEGYVFDPSNPSITDCNHAWNEVYVNGNWIYVDVTWACPNYYSDGAYEKGEDGVSGIWFDCGLEAFADAHCTIVPNSPSLSYDTPVDIEPDDCYFRIPNMKGIGNGAAKTTTGLCLPDTVTMVTPNGSSDVSIHWILDDEYCEYNPSKTTEQTFNVIGQTTDGNKQIQCRVTVYAKGFVPEAPLALTSSDIKSVTDNSIEIITNPEFEYSISGTNVWNSNGKFTNLEPNTVYNIICRYKADDSANLPAGKQSVGYAVKTLIGKAETPNAPTAKYVSYSSVSLTPTSGYEYRIEGGEWQTSNVFINLTPSTTYKFYQRIASSSTKSESDSSEPASFTTKKISGFLPGDTNGDGEINLQDVALLSQYCASWANIACSEVALDINGDGEVNLQDVALLAQYIAAWDDIQLSGVAYSKNNTPNKGPQNTSSGATGGSGNSGSSSGDNGGWTGDYSIPQK